MKHSFIIAGLLFCTFNSFSQFKIPTQLSGKVTDASNGNPLAGASVILSDARTGTATDSTGNYLLNNIPTGHTVIEVSYAGYKTIVAHFDLSETNTHNFSLSPSMLVNQGVTVTAVAGATSIRNAPVAITRINKTELLSRPSTNIIDALTRQPGVSSLSTGPAISKPIIRGLGYNRIVVINDGLRQEGQQWGDEHGIEIDENSVNRVEIVKGPASLIYGSDALAGVINILTTVPVPAETIRGSILSSYQTNNKQRSLFANVAGNNNGFNWNVWGDYKAAADYKNKFDGRVFNSKFNEKNAGGYLGYNGAWGFTHFIVSSFNQNAGIIEGERNNLGNFVKPVAGGGAALPTNNDFNSINPLIPRQGIGHLKFILDNSFRLGKNRLTLNVGWQNNTRKEFGNADATQEEDLHFQLRTINYNAIYHFADKNGWTNSIGINGMQQQNKNKGSEVLIPEYRLFDIGAFIYLQKTKGAFTYSGGIRFDTRTLHSDEFVESNEIKFKAFTKNFRNVSGSAGVSYAATEKVLFKFNLAKGFRAPGIPELASNGTHEGTNRYEYGNRNLKSESSFQADAAMELASDHVLFAAAVFYNRINNFIYYSKLQSQSGTDSVVDVNGDLIPAFAFAQKNASLYGGEFSIDIHPHPLDWLHWENTFSYVRGRFATAVENTNNLPLIPAARWISEVRAEFFADGKTFRNLALHMEVDRTFAQNKNFTAFDTETPTQGYTLLNASVSTNIMRRNKPFCSLYFIASNLGDVAYQNHLSRLKYAAVNNSTGRQGVFNTGRNFTVRLSVPLHLK